MNRIQGKLLTSERGFGMIELIIAMAIFMLVATGGVTAVLQAFNVNRLGKEEAFANLYAQEGIEGVLSIKNRDFSNLSEGTFGLSSSGGQWNFSGPFDTNDKYRREVTIAQGQRDGSGSIVDSGGTVDSDLFKITSNVTWNFSPTRINSVDLVTYLTQWDKSIISASVLARIAYYDESNKDLKYAECASNCTTASNWTTVTIDGADDVGKYASLDVDGSRVGVSYYEESNKDLKYAQCSSNCTNASNWDIVAVDSTNDVGEYTSLVFQNGSPRISYHYKDSLDLRYAQCSADCALSTNWTTITIDSGGDTGQFTSIGADGTKVGIAYYNLSNKDLKYAQCSSNCTVSSNWSNTVVDASGETGTYASLAFSSGNPRISYYEESNKDLKYAQCNTSCTSGSSAWAKVVVDAPATTGLHTSMAIDSSGNPRISYFRESGTRLKYAECNSNCTVSSNWSSGDITGPPGSRGKFSSLHLDGGRPRVSYYNESAKDLEFISCETGCTSSGNWTRITIQSLGDVGQYTSLKIK
ncbi:MAG: hypothetical protein A2687_02020 [Candidatus Levybacteria bacterium RIFCSPHIGHO2_01_FULL_38_26]|nr:MAG: hypothetical protein A2687_02020 [Candidatus Levybacteria bacterium RIFCSPHIGHO2_01_FULL_38_26]